MPAKKIEYNRADMLVCQKRFGLEMDIQIAIKSKYRNYKDLLQLTRDVLNDLTLDENSDQYKNVKNYVARLHKGVEIHNYTEDQIQYIVDNGEKMRPTDIARVLFPDVKGPMIAQVRQLTRLLDALDLKYVQEDLDREQKILGPYVAPHKDHNIIAIINRHHPDASLSISTLDSEQKKQIQFLKRHMSSNRFVAMMSAIRDPLHREVFEAEFVRLVGDKPDLPVEEVNGYMNLANDYVLSLMITEQMTDLNDRLKEATADDEEGRRYTKNISDSLSTKTTEFNSCQHRMKELHKDLHGKRADRVKTSIALNDSLAKFIELAKKEEGRKYMLRLAHLDKEEVKKEINRIQSLDDLADCYGISAEEILAM